MSKHDAFRILDEATATLALGLLIAGCFVVMHLS
jgi:hypothetical protein